MTVINYKCVAPSCHKDAKRGYAACAYHLAIEVAAGLAIGCSIVYLSLYTAFRYSR